MPWRPAGVTLMTYTPPGIGAIGKDIRMATVDLTADTFEETVSGDGIVLVDFWAEWCGPCKRFGPIFDEASRRHPGVVFGKVDTEAQHGLATEFQIRSIPTVYLVKGGQLVDGFQGALPEGQVREFLRHHGIEPMAPAVAEPEPAAEPTRDPHAEVVRLRAELAATPDSDTIKLDLALALLETGAVPEAERLLDALPANLATDDRSVRARARLGFLALVHDAPPAQVLESAIAVNPADLRARHLLGVRHVVEGRPEAGLEQFIEMLARDRAFDDGLPRKALVDAFRIIDDAALVSRYRRKMSALLF